MGSGCFRGAQSTRAAQSAEEDFEGEDEPARDRWEHPVRVKAIPSHTAEGKRVLKPAGATAGQEDLGLEGAGCGGSPGPIGLQAAHQEIWGLMASTFLNTPMPHGISSVHFIVQAPVGPRCALQRGQSPLGEGKGMGTDGPVGLATTLGLGTGTLWAHSASPTGPFPPPPHPTGPPTLPQLLSSGFTSPGGPSAPRSHPPRAARVTSETTGPQSHPKCT